MLRRQTQQGESRVGGEGREGGREPKEVTERLWDRLQKSVPAPRNSEDCRSSPWAAVGRPGRGQVTERKCPAWVAAPEPLEAEVGEASDQGAGEGGGEKRQEPRPAEKTALSGSVPILFAFLSRQ